MRKLSGLKKVKRKQMEFRSKISMKIRECDECAGKIKIGERCINHSYIKVNKKQEYEKVISKYYHLACDVRKNKIDS